MTCQPLPAGKWVRADLTLSPDPLLRPLPPTSDLWKRNDSTVVVR
jgi:hypothetical protein